MSAVRACYPLGADQIAVVGPELDPSALSFESAVVPSDKEEDISVEG